MDTSVWLQDLQVGFMERGEGGQIFLRSVHCCAPTRPSLMCVNCKKSTKLLQNLRRRIPAQMSDTIIEQAEKTLTVEAPATDDIFQITKTRLANPICKWSDCTDGVDPFGNVYDLVQHVSSHIIPQLDIAPVQREYTCQWEECRKVYKKRQALLTHIQDMHTGKAISSNINFF